MQEYEATLIGAFFGAGASVLTGVIVHLLNKIHQDRIQRNQLAVQLAIEKMKRRHEFEQAKFMANFNNGIAIYNDPHLQSIYAQMVAFAEAMDRKRRVDRWQRWRKWLGAAWALVVSWSFAA